MSIGELAYAMARAIADLYDGIPEDDVPFIALAFEDAMRLHLHDCLHRNEVSSN